jgi:hypothetical protein
MPFSGPGRYVVTLTVEDPRRAGRFRAVHADRDLAAHGLGPDGQQLDRLRAGERARVWAANRTMIPSPDRAAPHPIAEIAVAASPRAGGRGRWPDLGRLQEASVSSIDPATLDVVQTLR